MRPRAAGGAAQGAPQGKAAPQRGAAAIAKTPFKPTKKPASLVGRRRRRLPDHKGDQEGGRGHGAGHGAGAGARAAAHQRGRGRGRSRGRGRDRGRGGAGTELGLRGQLCAGGVLRLLGGLVLRSSMRWWRQVEVGGGGVGIQAATVGRGGASS